MRIDLEFARFVHDFLNATNGCFTGFLKVITLFGNSGIGFIIVGIILLLFQKTRKRGFCLLMAFLIGFVLFELILKNAVQRPRPFIDQSSEYFTFWQAAGSLKQGGYSFPSGHTTVATSFGIIMFALSNKKYSWIYLLIPLLMGFTRVYFMVHYLTDVLGGIIAGMIATSIGYGIYYGLNKTSWMQQFFDLPNFFYKRKSKDED